MADKYKMTMMMMMLSEEKEVDERNICTSSSVTHKKIVPSKKETLSLLCEWASCNEAPMQYMDVFLSHVKGHRNYAQAQNGEFRCEWLGCGFSTRCAKELTRHVYFHAYHAKIRCIGKNILKRFESQECCLENTGRNLVPELPEDFRCCWQNCSDVFDNAELFYRHAYHHAESYGQGKNPKGGATCLWAACNGQFQNQYKLRDHLRSHTQEKVVACPTCGALFSNRTKLLDHIKRQTPVEMQDYQCSHCSKRFSSERLLRDHMRTHINHYKCCYCDMTCPSPSSLSNHIRYRHSDSKPFTCDFCEYACKSQADLARHLVTHSSAAPYKCSISGCSYSTRSCQSLTNHTRKVHGNDKTPRYMCHICDKLCSRGNYLTNHLLKKHKFRWPSGHSRFRYKCDEDGFFRLQTVRYESIELTQQMIATSQVNDDDNDDAADDDDDDDVTDEDNQKQRINHPATGFIELLHDNSGDIVVTFEQMEQ